MALIKKIEAIPLANLEAKPEDCDGTAETVVIRIFDENGIWCIGECDAPAYVVKSVLEMTTQHIWSKNISEILIGSDPIEITAWWECIYEGTCFPGIKWRCFRAL